MVDTEGAHMELYKDFVVIFEILQMLLDVAALPWIAIPCLTEDVVNPIVELIHVHTDWIDA